MRPNFVDRIGLLCGLALAAAGCHSSGVKNGDPGDGGAPGNDDGSTPLPSATGITKVGAGEYVTTYLYKGRLYGVAGTLPRIGGGDNPGPLFPPAEVSFDPSVTIADVAGGLHFTIATDSKGQVWEWGDISSNPALANSNVPVQIATDSKGNAFNLLTNGKNVRSMAASIATSVAVKGDGTVWVWDDTTGGMQGDGTAGSATQINPVEVTIPLASGASITKVVISDVIVALASDGTVWSWGGNNVLDDLGSNSTDYMSPHQVAMTSTSTPLPKIVDIATGQSYSYALAADGTLYSWGTYMEITGMCSGWCPSALPLVVTQVVTGSASVTNASGAHITSIYSNSEASYAIMSDGTLWAWGSDGEGLVGDGKETDFATSTPPYTWDWGKDDMLVAQAVQLLPSMHNFSQIFTGTADVFYTYALTTDGRLFSWGRNKTGDLGSGVYPTNSQQAATYPNSWDVTTPTEVSPMNATEKPTSTPYCIQNMSAADCWCGSGPSDPQTC